MTILATANQQGGTDFRCVRVTDGTDTAAQVVVGSDNITFTSRYSGTGGNGTRIAFSAGSKAGTWRAVISLPVMGFLPEVFDNIEGTGNTLWQNLARAVNQGQFGTQSGSEIVIATAGAGTAAPSTTTTYALAGGTDGAANVTDAMLVGVDAAPRTGMYALRGTGVSVFALAECVDQATFPSQLSFGRSESSYPLMVGPKGDTITNAVSVKQSVGLDDWSAKLLFGDWCYWLDNTNGLPERLVSPQGFALGRYMTLSPEQSGLNKQIFNIIGTQRTRLARPYSDADLQMLGQNGIDAITNPVPGGPYFGLRFGRNASSNPSIRGDNYTRMTNYLATTLDKGMGIYAGQLNTPRLRNKCKQTLDSFLGAMLPSNADLEDGMIEGFNTVCDESNNPPNRRGLGWLTASAQVRYLGIVENINLSLEGGQTVQITRQRIGTAVGAV